MKVVVNNLKKKTKKQIEAEEIERLKQLVLEEEARSEDKPKRKTAKQIEQEQIERLKQMILDEASQFKPKPKGK